MKKKIAAVAVILSLVSIAAMGTMAYFTDSAVAHNVITSGNIDIELIDKTLKDNVEIKFPENGLSSVMPGMTKDKIVRVQNEENSQDAWVRVLVHTEIIGKDGENLTTTPDGETVIIINYLNPDKKWEHQTMRIDGVEYDCWFYSEPLKAGEATPNLFETVTFSGVMDNDYQGCTVNIDVLAQAVQADNVTAEQLAAENLWPTMETKSAE